MKVYWTKMFHLFECPNNARQTFSLTKVFTWKRHLCSRMTKTNLCNSHINVINIVVETSTQWESAMHSVGVGLGYAILSTDIWKVEVPFCCCCCFSKMSMKLPMKAKSKFIEVINQINQTKSINKICDNKIAVQSIFTLDLENFF